MFLVCVATWMNFFKSYIEISSQQNKDKTKSYCETLFMWNSVKTDPQWWPVDQWDSGVEYGGQLGIIT